MSVIIFLLVVFPAITSSVQQRPPCWERPPLNGTAFAQNNILNALGRGYDPTRAEKRQPIIKLTSLDIFFEVGGTSLEIPCEAQETADILSGQRGSRIDQVVTSTKVLDGRISAKG